MLAENLTRVAGVSPANAATDRPGPSIPRSQVLSVFGLCLKVTLRRENRSPESSGSARVVQLS